MARRPPRRIIPIDQLRIKPVDSGISRPDNVTDWLDGTADPLGGSLSRTGSPAPPRQPEQDDDLISRDDIAREALRFLEDDDLVDPAAGNGVRWQDLFTGRKREPWQINTQDRSVLTPGGVDRPAPRAHIIDAMNMERTTQLKLDGSVVLTAKKGPNHFLRLLRGYARNIRDTTRKDLIFVYMSDRTEDMLRTRLQRADVIPDDRQGTMCGCIVRRDNNLLIGEFYATVD